jgi:hypothetical protein
MFAHTRLLSFAAVLAAASLFGLAGEAAAMQCANHDNMAKALIGKFKETRRAMGVVNSTAVMEVFMSPQGTWTVVVTDIKGIACIAASGEEWQDVPVAVVGLES